jgi:hypothetical protein
MATPQEDVMKRLQGIKDARGPVGQMARGNNVYNGASQAAQSGPGGPDMGRPPTAVPQAAMDAVRAKLGTPPPPPATTPMQGSMVAAAPGLERAAANQNKAMSGIAKAALAAAAQRKLKRGR